MSSGIKENDLISYYFRSGYTYLEICEFLKLHDISMSLSSLKRRLKDLGLTRKDTYIVNDNELKVAIEEEITGSGCFLGYRKVWARLRKKGIVVKRKRVMTMLKQLDPEGVESRTKKRLRRRLYHAKGPNFIWHIDGHDKLKPYGFSVHGCIDGFSRKLIWLEVCPSNKNPEIIAKFYLDVVNKLGGVPERVRSDDGTENSIVEAIHTYLRSTHDGNSGFGSFLIGRSTSNQRIEAYWSQFVKDGPGWWMNFFKDMTDVGLYNSSDPVHNDCMRFCFMEILRKELHEVAELWNEHIISSSKFGNLNLPRGRPDTMYFLPHLYNTNDYKMDTNQDEVQEFIDNATMSPDDYSKEFEEFATIIMSEQNILKPNNVKEALNLYINLIRVVENFP